jgi:Spy/CpxP family protein refolding chaperone
MKKLSYLLSFVLVFAFSGGLFAQGMGNGNGMGNGMGKSGQAPGMKMAEKLNLTTDQMTKMKDLRNQFSEETLTLRTGINSKKMEIQTLMNNPEKNQSKILSLQKEKSALQLQLKEKALQLRINARKILTKEQIAMLPPGGLRMGMGAGMGKGMNGGKGHHGKHSGRGSGRY